MSQKRRICFVSPYIYPLFNPDIKTMFGGFEVRIATIVRDIVQRGNYDVSIIVANHGQPHRETREGIELISWVGKAFYGITAQPSVKVEQPIVDSVPVEPPSVEPPSLTKILFETPIPATIVDVKEYSPEANGGLQQVRERVKRIYKRSVPWRIRIVITGLGFGLRESTKEVLTNWTHAAKLFVWGVRSSFGVFKNHVGPSVRVARTAAGNMADMPVYAEQIKIYAEADADIYVVPGNSLISAEVAFFCKKWKKAYVMLIGSDIDLNPEYLLNPNGTDLYYEPNAVKLFTVKNAAAHIVQNERQFALAQRYGVSPVLIRNPMNMERIFPKAEDANLVLWVGNTDERVKRPSLLVEVARRLPEYSFLMIVTPATEAGYLQLCEMAKQLPNLEIISRVPFSEVERYYAQAKVFVNTSSFEGFPNTFLQSGKYGVPVVSLKVDPNGLLSQHRCGLVCNDDLDLLAASIQKLMSEPETYAQASLNILNYVRQNHDKDVIIPQLEEQFQAVLAHKRKL